MAPLVGGLGAVNLNFGHEENMSRSITPQPPKKKSKKKKRKPQASNSENTESPKPDQADDHRTKPEKVQITVNKRAWDVFQDALFFVPAKGRGQTSFLQ